MAITWFTVVILGLITVALLRHKNAQCLYRLTEVSGEVEVIRDGQKKTISQDFLVPGDIITVVPGLAYCDMILVESHRLLVDESALTGEANPIGKNALDPNLAKELYSDKSHKKNTIFAGTTILEADNARAIVSGTSSYTSRGELIRDIFAYRRQKFKFDSEVPIVVTLLFFVGCVGWGLAWKWTGEVFVYGYFYGIYVVAACLPPLLPTVFTVSVGVSDGRLAEKRITCTNSESILVAGKVTRAFFDKTGTLTRQGLDFVAARGKSAWVEGDDGHSEELDMKLTTDELKLGMACCHSLTPSRSGEMIGNPVDRVIFATSKAKMDFDPSKGGHMKITDATGKTVTVVKHFDFDHNTMTQSVIIRHDDTGVLLAFCKGSGEAVRDRCIPETLPQNFDHALRQSSKSGLYQISMASKVISTGTTDSDDVSQLTRKDVESGLTFQGVINFKNLLRDNACHVIKSLEAGEVVPTMITGDNVLTGIRIAREAGILKANKKVFIGELDKDSVVWKSESDQLVELPTMREDELADALTSNFQLAMSGAAWREWQVMDPKLALQFQDSVRVFGRCNPYDKVSIVQGSALTGHVTLMTGDGGNDCGALKAAHVGVALSDAEASIVAPFTSLDKDIGAVLDVLLEGRCALASSLASYKFIILYGQTETSLQLIAAYFAVTFPQSAWIFTDGIWVVTLSLALPLAKAATTLAPNRPTASILGVFTLASALGVYVINFCYVVIGYVYLNSQDWYHCRKWTGTDLSNVLVIGDNYETSVLFAITGFQIFSSAIIYNFGYEFRQSWYKNYVLAFLICAYVFMHWFAVLSSGKMSCLWRLNCLSEDTYNGFSGQTPIQNIYNTTIMPESFRRGLVAINVANLCTTVGWDYFVVNGTRQRVAAKRRGERNAGNETVEGSKSRGNAEGKEETAV
jgi:predicted P-type ATPase